MRGGVFAWIFAELGLLYFVHLTRVCVYMRVCVHACVRGCECACVCVRVSVCVTILMLALFVSSFSASSMCRHACQPSESVSHEVSCFIAHPYQPGTGHGKNKLLVAVSALLFSLLAARNATRNGHGVTTV